MLSGDIRQLISNSDEQNVFWRSLLQQLNNIGGDTRDLNRLVSDAKGDKEIILQIAKLAMGQIWGLVAKTRKLSLTPSDFEIPAKEFSNSFTGIGRNASAERDFTESKPKGPCEYRLHHYLTPQRTDELILAKNEEHAGWRELLAYVVDLQAYDIRGRHILAVGSRLVDTRPIPPDLKIPIFPCATTFDDSANVWMSWKGVENTEKDRLGLDCFYLIRVYPD